MRTHNERIKKLIRAANRLLVAVGNEPLEIPEVAEPTYRTPTVRDLLNGPIECEVRDTGEWRTATLTAIDNSGSKHPPYFAGVDPYDRCWFAECRIPAEPELPPEKPEWELIDGKLFFGEWTVELFQLPDGKFCILVTGRKGDIGFDRLDQAVRYVNDMEASQ